MSRYEVLPSSLPGAWAGELTTALGISTALSVKYGQIIPWKRVREAIDGAYRARYLETTLDSGAWPCEYPGAQSVKLRIPNKDTMPTIVDIQPSPKPGVRVAEADLRPSEIQDLADVIGDLTAAAVGTDLKLHVRIEVGGEIQPENEILETLNKILKDVSDDLKF